MPVVDTTRTFTNNEQITSTKLNEIMDNSSFVSGAVVLSGGLEVTGGGQMQIATSGVTTSKIADSNVTTVKVSDGAITPIKLANSDFGDFTVSSGVATIDNNAITTAKIADGNVTPVKLAGTSGTRPIQIIQSVKYDIQTIDTDATSWVDITSLSATITRISTTSKHRIQAVINNSTNDGNQFLMFRVLRGTTPIGLGNADGSRVRITSGGGYAQFNNITASCIDFIDDTSGVSDASLTYKIQARISSVREGYINRSYNDTNASDYTGRAISTLTITELG